MIIILSTFLIFKSKKENLNKSSSSNPNLILNKILLPNSIEEFKQITYPEPVKEEEQEEKINYTLPITTLISQYLEKEGLSENQVAFSYYNTISSLQINFNEDQIMTLGSTYKLPLNMVISDKISQNLYSEDTMVAVRTLDGRKDDEYHRFITWFGTEVSIHNLQSTSLIDSNNISSESLIMLLGGWQSMTQQIQQYGFYITPYDNTSSTESFI